MERRALYTPEMDQKILEMRNQKPPVPWPEVAKALGRSESGVQMRMTKIKRKKVKRYMKRSERFSDPMGIQEALRPQNPPTRPMIALVGTPDEVTRSLASLFS